MKAAQFGVYGSSEVLVINDAVPVPQPQKGQVQIEVYAASINPIDWKVRAGFLKEAVPLKLPVTTGSDLAGVVTKVGEEVTTFQVGEEVFGQAGILHGGTGTLATFAVASTQKITHKPSKIDFLQAAALPLVGISALQAIEDEINLQKGQRILIQGGAGGIGNIAIQIAKARGAYVATTVSSKDIDFAKSLGAEEVIDYQTQNFVDIIKDYDAVFDTAGGQTTNKSFEVLKKGGILVSMPSQPDQSLAKKYQVKAIGQNTVGNPERLKRLSNLIENGTIHVHIDKIFPFDQTKEAFIYQETAHPKGKVVVNLK